MDFRIPEESMIGIEIEIERKSEKKRKRTEKKNE